MKQKVKIVVKRYWVRQSQLMNDISEYSDMSVKLCEEVLKKEEVKEAIEKFEKKMYDGNLQFEWNKFKEELMGEK